MVLHVRYRNKNPTDPCYTSHILANNKVQWQIQVCWITISRTYTIRYLSALFAPYNLPLLSYRTTTGITTFTLHSYQYIYQPRILSVYLIPPCQAT